MTLRPLLVACVLDALLLTSCGGGAGGGSGVADDVDPPPSASQVLVNPSSLEDLEELAERKGATVIGPVEGTQYFLVGLPPGVSADEFVADLGDEDEVEDCEEDEGSGAPEGGGSTIPVFLDDHLLSIATQPALDAIGVPAAHARGLAGAGVVVAVIDTGVVASSPVLEGHLAAGGRDFVDGDLDPSDEGNGLDDDGDGLVDEGVGHGTFVASLILAVAPEARILPIRALDGDAVGTASTVALAIAYAVEQGAHVVNLSAGLRREMSVIDQAVENAKQADVPVVAAAGNRGIDHLDYPADDSNVVAVAALDAAGRKAPFSSYGSGVDFCAPGVALVGAHPSGPSGTARWSGTSFSTALVTGCVALLRGGDPVAASEDLLRRLADACVPLDELNLAYGGKLGDGLVDVGRATEEAP